MAALRVVAGGTIRQTVGGYIEVTMPNLEAGVPHELVLAYASGFVPRNRAWLPMGPRLIFEDEIIVLPNGRLGREAPEIPPQKVDGLPIVPQPEQWLPTLGHLITSGFAFDHPALEAVQALAARQGVAFAGTTRVQVSEADMPVDAYEIEIEKDRVGVKAGSYGGVFYAGVTLLTLLQQGPIPCGNMKDVPRFEWRGQHLDTARHFYEVDTLLRLLDLMALLKLNRFHWHFADDEAFRLEVDCFPDLWEKSALRGEGQILPGLFSRQNIAGGSYSKSDVRQIIAHAKTLNIEILPEIEVPAHSLVIAAIYPDTQDPDDPGGVFSVQGYEANVLNPAMPRSWEIWEGLISEIGGLFPFGHIHLGCDELPEGTWMNSPRARALMRQEGLENTHDLQGWVMQRLAGFARKRGVRPAAWEEAVQGKNAGIGNDAILFSWSGQGPGLKAAQMGYDVVMTPAQNVYFDMAYSADPDDWGAAWAAFIDLPETINWDPTPDPALADRIIGVQGAFWSEFTSQDSQVWPMLMPRMLGLSMMAWQSQPCGVKNLCALASRYAIAEGTVQFLGDEVFKLTDGN